MPKVKVKCSLCEKTYEVYPYREHETRYCSRRCTGKVNGHNNKGRKCPKGSLAKLGSKNPMFGKKKTEEQKKQISKSVKAFFKENPDKIQPGKKGPDSPHWKGDDIGYHGIHSWIEKEKGRAKEGVCSMKNSECSETLQWANVSGKYRRDLEDWFILCSRHHFHYDQDRKDKLLKGGIKTRFKKGNKPWNKKC